MHILFLAAITERCVMFVCVCCLKHNWFIPNDQSAKKKSNVDLLLFALYGAKNTNHFSRLILAVLRRSVGGSDAVCVCVLMAFPVWDDGGLRLVKDERIECARSNDGLC